MNKGSGSLESPRQTEAARVRLTLDLSQKLNTVVDSLAAESDSSKADILRLAVEVLNAIKEAKKSGMHVGAWVENPDGSRREREFIGF